MKNTPLLIALLFAITIAGHAQTIEPSLLQKPTLSRTQVVFVYAGDLWIVSRDGGTATRLTTGAGVETDPKFSPDGFSIAFTGEYDGNVDIYVVPATGGVPRRLTYHPGADLVSGWTPDGKQILFRSGRTSTNPVPKLFTIPVDGGFPVEVPLPMGVTGSYSSDGTRRENSPTINYTVAWKQ
jgi:tricorn protease